MTPLGALLALGVAGAAALGVRKIRRAWELRPGTPSSEVPMRFPVIPPAGLIPDPALDETPGYVLVDERQASPWLLNLPRESIPRDDMIVERWRELAYTFVEVEVRSAAHTLVYSVFADGARIDGVRISVTARCAQMVADKIAGQMLTPKMEDDLYGSSDYRLPFMFEDVNTMGTNRVMIEHSGKMDQVLVTMGYSFQGPAALVAGGAAKSWNLMNTLKYPKALNYGFFGPRAPHLSVTGKYRVIQQPGTAHDIAHYDYSQELRLAHRLCLLDGLQKDIRDVMKDPATAPLLSTEGPMTVLRQPGVPDTST